MTTPHVNADLIQGLRDLADFLETHPQPEAQYAHNVTLSVFVTPEELTERIRGAGTVEKVAAGEWFWLRRAFGPHVVLDWTVAREKICRRVVVGTRVVPATPEALVAAQPERVEEIVKWECPESILRASAPESAAAAL